MKPRTLLLGPVIAAAFLAGCAGSRPAVDLAWPPPPQEPRVVYERSIYGSESLPRGFFGKVKDFFLGRSPDTMLTKPYGIALDGDRLFVADTGSKSVVVMDLGAGGVRSFNDLGRHGTLIEPVNVAVGPGGLVHVADTGLGKIAVFRPDGEFVRFVGEGLLRSPVGMAFSEGGRLYVVDSQQHRVHILDSDGEPMGGFGERGDGQGQFYHPLGITVGGDGTVYVVDAFHFAVQVFGPDGQYRFSFGPAADGMGSMARPRSVAVDSEGHLYVTDALNHNVQIYDPDGQLLLTFGVAGLAPGQFRLPAGIVITPQDRIYVADQVNRRIQEFGYRPGG